MLPNDFQLRMLAVHGEQGRRWLDDFSDLRNRYLTAWNLTLKPSSFPLSYNYVVPAVTREGREVVLKMGVPCRELESEMRSLDWFEGKGMVRALEANAEDGVMLLERVRPGTPLKLQVLADRDDEATSIASRTIRALRREKPPGNGFVTVEEWGKGFSRLRNRRKGGATLFASPLVDAAARVYEELCASTSTVALLHGDLHHENILQAEGGIWRAIDPKGIVGDPAFEVGALIRNPWPEIQRHPSLSDRLTRRIAQFSEELNLERDRVWGWAFSQAVLSAWWTFEDREKGAEEMLKFAEVLKGVAPLRVK